MELHLTVDFDQCACECFAATIALWEKETLKIARAVGFAIALRKREGADLLAALGAGEARFVNTLTCQAQEPLALTKATSTYCACGYFLSSFSVVRHTQSSRSHALEVILVLDAAEDAARAVQAFHDYGSRRQQSTLT